VLAATLPGPPAALAGRALPVTVTMLLAGLLSAAMPGTMTGTAEP
jgi:hypothetical protein